MEFLEKAWLIFYIHNLTLKFVLLSKKSKFSGFHSNNVTSVFTFRLSPSRKWKVRFILDFLFAFRGHFSRLALRFCFGRLSQIHLFDSSQRSHSNPFIQITTKHA